MISPKMTEAPISNSMVNVQFGVTNFGSLVGENCINKISSWSSSQTQSDSSSDIIFIMKLSLVDPNISISNFNANTKFAIYRAAPAIEY